MPTKLSVKERERERWSNFHSLVAVVVLLDCGMHVNEADTVHCILIAVKSAELVFIC